MHLESLSNSGSGCMSEKEGLLDMVSRGCLRLMKAGGGSLQREIITRSVTQEDSKRFAELDAKGYNATKIAAMTGRNPQTVEKHLRRMAQNRPLSSSGNRMAAA